MMETMVAATHRLSDVYTSTAYAGARYSASKKRPVVVDIPSDDDGETPVKGRQTKYKKRKIEAKATTSAQKQSRCSPRNDFKRVIDITSIQNCPCRKPLDAGCQSRVGGTLLCSDCARTSDSKMSIKLQYQWQFCPICYDDWDTTDFLFSSCGHCVCSLCWNLSLEYEAPLDKCPCCNEPMKKEELVIGVLYRLSKEIYIEV
ncbi:hypothetical protein V8C37DRAFT_392438 [Trichoderma ceciliae]